MTRTNTDTNEPPLHNNPDYMDLMYDEFYNGRIIWIELVGLITRLFRYIQETIFTLYTKYVSNVQRKVEMKSPQLPTKSPTDIYIENEKTRFIKYIDNANTNIDRNRNTDKLFYNRPEYVTHLKTFNNELEQKWKRNILFEATPRGNIIMFYDAYKMAFSYYSNESSYPYHILNATAMKYVRSFSCLDLFMDDAVTEFKSPLIEIIKNEGKENENSSKKKENSNMKIETKNNPAFAKFKNYKKEEEKRDKKNEKNDKEGKPKIIVNKNINKFVFMGKTDNFNILQKSKKNYSNILFAEKSKFDDIFSQETELQKQVMSYSEFKKLQQKKSE